MTDLQPDQKSEKSAPKNESRGQPVPASRGANTTVLYVIIGLLAAIIVIGIIYFIPVGQGVPGKITVVDFRPTGEVEQTTNFTVEFGIKAQNILHTNRPIVHDSLIDVSFDWEAVAFDPPIPGEFRWISAYKLRFYPNVALAPSTRYTAEVVPRVASEYGHELTGNRTFQFQTRRFTVNSASLSFELGPQVSGEAKLFATIEFSDEVDPKVAAKHLFIEYEDGESIPFELKTKSSHIILELTADGVKRGEKDKKIRLRLTEGLLPIGGTLGLERDYIQPILLPKQEHLRVERVTSLRDTPVEGRIRIAFNFPVRAKDSEQYISVEPEIGYRTLTSHHYLDLKGNFSSDTTYHLTIRKGLPAVDGSTLRQDFSTAVSFIREDIPPQMGWVGDGFYLTRSGNLNLGLSTINMNTVTLEVEKIYSNNLIFLLHSVGDMASEERYYWYNRYSLDVLGEKVQEADLVLQSERNEETITPVSVEQYLPDDRKGIFRFIAREKDSRWHAASRWVVVTDMGILAKKAGGDLWVWVNSLSTLEPLRGAEVSLISRNNQTLMTAVTDDQGIAVLKEYLVGSEGFEPYIITASHRDDLSFLELHRREISTTDFDVGGTPMLQHGYSAYVYNERAIYRPGEKVHLAAIVRAKEVNVPPTFPVRLRVLGPDKNIVTEQRAVLNEQGAVEFELSIPEYLKTGRYVALLLVGDKEEIGRTGFNIEEFVPDRMKVTVATDRDAYLSGDTVRIDVKGMTLFGPPAAGRAVEGAVEIEANLFEPAQWRSFSFHDGRKSFSKIELDLDAAVLNDQGYHSYEFSSPADIDPPSSLQGVIVVTVLEPGGRGVSAYRRVTIHPQPVYVGLRASREGYAKPKEDTPFEFVLVDTEGEAIQGRDIQVEFYHIYWHSILKKVDDSRGYRYVSEKVEHLIHEFTVVSEEGVGRFSVRPEDYGSYRVVVQDAETGVSSATEFYASGWGYSPWAMDFPERIELDVDKDAYLPGEKATVQVRAPFAGKLLVTIERDEILSSRVVTLTENTAELEVPVIESYKPNVYISAHLIRSTLSLDQDSPARAFGTIPLKVNTSAQRLKVGIDVPTEIRPRSELKVRIQMQDMKEGNPYVTVAAVDEGICQLTGFQTPDAHKHFYGKKRLTVESFDTYGIILPEIASSSASGGMAEAAMRYLTPVTVRRVKPVAFWSGLVKTDENGMAEVQFSIPQFNGSIRLMALALWNDQFGSAQTNVIVREPIVMTPTFPRFLASGDTFVLPVNVYNGTEAASSFDIRLTTKGPVGIIGEELQTISISKDGEAPVYFKLEAEATIGEVECTLSAQGNGERSEMSVDVPVRPPVPFITLAGNGSIYQNTPASFDFPSNWLPGTATFSLTVSPFPSVRFTRSLQYLLRYPHGCIEQTTSTLFPLLYFSDVARLTEPELFRLNSADSFIGEGIAKLERMQLSTGDFAFWPGGSSVSNWGSIYASHFLVEARKAGYEVSDRVYKRTLSALHKRARSYDSSDPYTYQSTIYACYVLALAGEPEKSTMIYLKNNALNKLRGDSQFLLAGAFALSGDLQTGQSLLPQTVTLPEKEERETGRNFHSNTRAKAIMLNVLAEVDPSSPSVPLLVAHLTEEASQKGRWQTTQENAYAFLALGKILRTQEEANYTGTISIEGDVFARFDSTEQMFSDPDWDGKQVSIALEGSGVCYYYWRVDGIPSDLHIDEYDHDLVVRRRYLDKHGHPQAYDSFRQGEMVIAEITATALHEQLENVAIVDMVPAGFEIENPRLQSRRGIDWIEKKEAQRPTYMDIRDDRLIVYCDLNHRKESRFYYGLRAVTQGSFTLPPVRGEAMYAPLKASVASSGKIAISGPGSDQ